MVSCTHAKGEEIGEPEGLVLVVDIFETRILLDRARLGEMDGAAVLHKHGHRQASTN